MIIDPITKYSYSLNTIQGKKILKKYILNYQGAGIITGLKKILGCKSNRTNWNIEPNLTIKKKAIKSVLNGNSVTNVSKEFNIPKRTLRRFICLIKKNKSEKK